LKSTSEVWMAAAYNNGGSRPSSTTSALRWTVGTPGTYDATTPTGTLKPYPVPNIPLTGVIYGPTLLAEFTSPSQTLTLVPGTRRFLRTAIALEIADAYEKQPSQELKEKAREARADFKRANQRIEDMVLWPSGQYDIYSDTYLR